MTALEIRDAIAEAVAHTLLQSKAMQSLTIEDVAMLARAAAGNAAMVIAAEDDQP